ncbi:ERG2/sigma1 receptor-like protein [Cokeromyces recurvatus]|uniref:ERG2/sigma1 receptor-like protein n=1 Tax=Cokeromyces recurvatus TaxID=90255 RepID=UPI00221E98AF|nr:ERG2/sigma1 receptor-like protein [Cokeromyces recurvatus]KAI7902950.1 ERG2/sigma1 receptor-like protein [Cokeromyces recurvatus]
MAKGCENCTKKKSKSCFMKLLFVLTLFIAIFVGLDQIKHRWYIFDQYKLQEIAQRNIAKYSEDTHEMITHIAEDLEKEYPGHITLKEEWVFNNAGGAMGSMWILHASITEYVIIFGTPVGTEGHTGRYISDDYFIILEGEQWAAYAGDLDKAVYKPGEMHHLARGDAQHYRIPDRAWALEYARGWVPAMLPFGMFDFMFSTVDFVTFYNTFRLYGKSLVRELLQGKI